MQPTMNATVGRNLKRLREMNRLTQDQIASFLKINRSTYSNYESGEREAPFEVLESVSDLFGCDLYLLFEENESAKEEMLACAFRVDSISNEDLHQIAQFKKIVKNYLKMDRNSAER